MFTIKIEAWDGSVQAMKSGEEVTMVYKAEYRPGDKIIVEDTLDYDYIVLQIDDTMGEHFVLLKDKKMKFTIPFDEKKVCYSPKSFSGDIHVIKVRKAMMTEIAMYKNVALNPYDCHEAKNCYPHAKANVETRGEAVFAAKNAINGNHANESHGNWPYESWGINRNPDAVIEIDFGRKVRIDKFILYTRADFPHDSYWTNATVSFSDGSNMNIELVKSEKAQRFTFEEREVEWVRLEKLIKAEDESPFPALSQIEVYGYEV